MALRSRGYDACMGRGETRRRLRRGVIPTTIRGCLFDLDGVLTKTARVHEAAWKRMFDDFLREREGESFRPFEHDEYLRYVDGRLRLDGVRRFLESRDIALPEGSPADTADMDTVHGLAARKNGYFLDALRRDGVEVYAESVQFVEAVRAAEFRTAVVTASRNCSEVLEAAGLVGLFEVQIDGNVAHREGLRGKPEPDTFLAAARALGLSAAASAVFEDAEAGVEAGRRGAFGWVVGVDRTGNAKALRERGADIVVGDLGELLED